MYKDFGAALPAPTQILINVSNFTSRFWYLVIGAVGGGVFLFQTYGKTPAGRLRIDRFKLKLPVFGDIISKVSLVELNRTLSLLVSAGISLLTALQISLDALDNKVYRDALERVIKSVEKGQSFSQALARTEEFPVLMNQMVSVGEETGKIDEVLLKLANYFESESEHAVKGLTSAMEPLIMIVLGVGVGFLIIAIIMPIYNLTNQF
jgi:type IV pilus assembly protein PilC